MIRTRIGKPSPSMGEGWVGVMPGDEKAVDEAPLPLRRNAEPRMPRLLIYLTLCASLAGFGARAEDAQPDPSAGKRPAIALPLPTPELVPPLPKWSLVPRTAKSAPLGTVVIGQNPALKGAPRENAVALNEYGYVEEEYLVSGTAGARYTTRILVRRPVDPNRFSGTVQIEPLRDRSERAANWEWTWPYLLENGDVWVGFTASKNDAETMLKEFDASRYAAIVIPEDGARLDIMTQIAWVMRSPDGLLAGLHFDDKAAIVPGLFRVYASGWGPTGCMLRDFMQTGQSPRARTPEGRPVINAYLIGTCPAAAPLEAPADAAVIQVVSESEYGSAALAAATAAARQPDLDLPKGRYRWYDVAGAGDWSTSDLPQFSIAAYQMGQISALRADCGAAARSEPGLRYFARAILYDLDRWLRVGGHPPPGAMFELDAGHRVKRDGNGIALGGVRADWVDVPVSSVTAAGDDPPIDIDGVKSCGALGVVKAFPPDKLTALYKDHADYVNKVTDDVIKLVNGRYLLPRDGDAFIAEAKAQ
jgi:hypothetical protein